LYFAQCVKVALSHHGLHDISGRRQFGAIIAIVIIIIIIVIINIVIVIRAAVAVVVWLMMMLMLLRCTMMKMAHS
jgi:hypothetical protein